MFLDGQCQDAKRQRDVSRGMETERVGVIAKQNWMWCVGRKLFDRGRYALFHKPELCVQLAGQMVGFGYKPQVNAVYHQLLIPASSLLPVGQDLYMFHFETRIVK